MIVLLVSLAFAQAPEWGSLDEPPPDKPARASTVDLMAMAEERFGTGDYQGARILLDQALERPDVDADLASYRIALAWELGGDPGTAIRLYEDGLTRWPASPNARHRLFRKAECLAALGAPDEALKLVKPLEKLDLPLIERLQYDLATGVWWVQAGKERRGLRILADALSRSTPVDVPWFQARARATVTAVYAERAAELTFDKREKKVIARIEERAGFIDRMESQVTEIAELDEPEWVLDGVLTLGDAYRSFGDDLLVHRRPKKLTPDQVVLYEQGVAERVEVLWVKAVRIDDLGLDMAHRIGWHSPRIAEIERRRADTVASIEAL